MGKEIMKTPPTSIGKWKVLCIMGKGGFGVVVKAVTGQYELHDEGKSTAPPPPTTIAIKCIQIETEKDLERAHREICLHSKLNHKNIVQFLGDQIDETGSGFHYILMEFVPSCVRNLVKEHGPVRGHRAKRMAMDVIEALWYLHCKGIMHCDVKPENFLYFEAKTQLKLCDFGLARSVYGDVPGKQRLFRGKPGTKEYQAPEVLSELPRHGLPTDVWSLGISLFYIIYGKRPWKRADHSCPAFVEWELYEDALFDPGQVVEKWVACVIRGCLRVSAGSRSSIEELRQDLISSKV